MTKMHYLSHTFGHYPYAIDNCFKRPAHIDIELCSHVTGIDCQYRNITRAASRSVDHSRWRHGMNGTKQRLWD